MEPALSIDDMVFIKQTDNVKVGDIISFRDENGKKVMHRIVEIRGNDIITKGDANNTTDKAINKDQIVGVYVGRIKYVGKVFRLVKTPIGITLYTLIIFIVLLFPNYKNKIGKDSTPEKEKIADKRLTNILFLEIIYTIFLVGFIIVGNYAKYQTKLEGSSKTTVATWNNNIELLSEDTISFDNGQINTKIIEFNLLHTSEVTSNYSFSIDNVSPKLAIELSGDGVTAGIKQIDNMFTIKINNTEKIFDINELQTNREIISNNIKATYEFKNEQKIYTFEDSISGKLLKVIGNNESNYNYRFINYGIFQLNDNSQRQYTLKLSTIEVELPNFDSLELYATFEQID